MDEFRIYANEEIEEVKEWVKDEMAGLHLCARPGCTQGLRWLDGKPLEYRGWFRLALTYCSEVCLNLDQERASTLLAQHDPLEGVPPLVLRQTYDAAWQEAGLWSVPESPEKKKRKLPLARIGKSSNIL